MSLINTKKRLSLKNAHSSLNQNNQNNQVKASLTFANIDLFSGARKSVPRLGEHRNRVLHESLADSRFLLVHELLETDHRRTSFQHLRTTYEPGTHF